MKKQLIACFLLTSCSLSIGGCSQQAKVNNPTAENKPCPLTDKPLTSFQDELLNLAFDTATAIPVNPHGYDRSRAQQKVIDTSFELDQPQRAIGYIEKIADWRRGESYGDFAIYSLRHSCSDGIQQYLDRAQKISDQEEDWQRDRIRVKIAQTHVLLGETEKANSFEKGVVEASESGKVIGVKAMIADEESFDKQIKGFDELIASGNFDIMKNALDSSTELFNRFYDDVKKRSLIEAKIKTSMKKAKMPVSIQTELFIKLTESALNHKDQAQALLLVSEAQLLIDTAQWRTAEFKIPFVAKLAGLRFLAGDEQKAKADADALLKFYDSESNKIVNIYRAGVLRPIAEAYQSMSDTKSALAVYKKALEAGVENPNSRPRAEDLSATCISLALHRVQPDDELWNRIQQIKQGLGDPW